jgi:hypothetical protein
MTKRKKPPVELEPEAEFIERLGKTLERRMAEFESLLGMVMAKAVRATMEYAKEKRINRLEAAVVFDFAKECGLAEAINCLPFWPLTRAELDALPPYAADALGWQRLQIGESWILINATPNGCGAFFRPDISGPSPLN